LLTLHVVPSRIRLMPLKVCKPSVLVRKGKVKEKQTFSKGKPNSYVKAEAEKDVKRSQRYLL